MPLDRPIGPGFLTRHDWKNDIMSGHGFVECTDGILRYAVLPASLARMRVIHRRKKEKFQETISSWVARQPFSLAIPGCFADNGVLKARDLLGITMEPDRQAYMGMIADGGSRFGEPRPRRAFLAADGSEKISIGRGDLPAGAAHGFSGLGALLVKGVKFPTGLSGDEERDDFYSIQLGKGLMNGNTVVAIAEKENLLVALIKPHAAAPGLSLDDLRDKLFVAGFSDAVFLDGSDSVFWNLRGVWGAKQGFTKDRVTSVGLAFLYPVP